LLERIKLCMSHIPLDSPAHEKMQQDFLESVGFSYEE
jgi:hypothetical protein